MDKKVYIIYTLPRSGSTLFGEALKGHSKICYRGEAKIFYRIVDILPIVLLRGVVGRLLRYAYQAHPSKAIFIDKSPSNILRYKKLSVLFPGHIKIGINRNISDVRRSMSNEWKNKGNPKDSMLERESTLPMKVYLYFKKEFFGNMFILKSLFAPLAIVVFFSLGLRFIINQIAFFRVWGPKTENLRIFKKIFKGEEYLINNQITRLEELFTTIEFDEVISFNDIVMDSKGLVKRLFR